MVSTAFGTVVPAKDIRIEDSFLSDLLPEMTPAPTPLIEDPLEVGLAPVAVAGPDRVIAPGENTKFDGSLSYDPDGVIIEYFWDFDDGDTKFGVFAEHIYTTVGTYHVKLMVTDAAGNVGYDYLMVLVKDEEESSYALHLIYELMAELEELDLSKGLLKSLRAKLESAADAAERGVESLTAAANKLGAFINEVEAQNGKGKPGKKGLPADVGSELISKANWIIAQLEEDSISLLEDANSDFVDLLTERHFSTEISTELVEFELKDAKPEYLVSYEPETSELDFTAYEYSLNLIEVEYTGDDDGLSVMLDEEAIKLELPDWWHHKVISIPGELTYGETGSYAVAVGAPGNHPTGTFTYSIEVKHASGMQTAELEVVDYDSLSKAAKKKYAAAREAIAGMMHWDWTLDTDQLHNLLPGGVLDLPPYGLMYPDETMGILLEEFMDCNSELVTDLSNQLVLLYGVEYPHFTYAQTITIQNTVFAGDLILSGYTFDSLLIENVEVYGDLILEDIICNDITLRNNFVRDLTVTDCEAYGEIIIEDNQVLGDLSVVLLWDLVMTLTGNVVAGNLQVLIGFIPGGLPAFGVIQLTVTNCFVGTAGVANTGDIIITIVSNWIPTNIATIVTNNHCFNDIIITEAANTVFWGVISTWVSGNVVFNDIMLYEPFLVDLPAGSPPLNVGNTITSWGGIIKTVVNNRVGRNIGILVSTTQMPPTGMITVTVQNNMAGGFIGSQVSGNIQLMDILTQVQNNMCADIFVFAGMNGYNFMRDIITDVQNNQVSNDIWIDVDRNNVFRNLIARINGNQVTRMMDIDITNNWPEPYLVILPSGAVTLYKGFTSIAISIRNNHVVREDLIIDISNNRMTYDQSVYNTIYIERNGAGRDIKISINDNDIDFGSMIIQIIINRSNRDMEITIKRNGLRRISLLTLLVSGNTGLNRPKINIERSSSSRVISGNVIFDAQATGPDTDLDGLSDNYEWLIGTSPTNPDTDNDGLIDGWNDADGSRTWDYTDANSNGAMDVGEFEDLGEVGDPANTVTTGTYVRNQGCINTLYNMFTAWNTPLEDPSPTYRDIFVEADFMIGFQLSMAAQNMVIASFGKEGINLHLDTGWAVGPAGLAGAVGTGGEIMPLNNPLRFIDPTPAGGQKQWFDIYTIKNGETQDLNGDGLLEQAHLARNRLGIFHYSVIGLSYWQPGIQVPPQPLISAGVSEPVGSDDFFVGEGTITIIWAMPPPVGFSWTVTNQAVIAGVFMHELGHNLGLPHQPDPTNPAAAGTAWGHVNYRSVMSSYSPNLPPPFPGGDLQSYIYTLLDYSDGTNGPNDFNDWGNLDLITGITTWQTHNW
jgi:PKD repeat protein